MIVSVGGGRLALQCAEQRTEAAVIQEDRNHSTTIMVKFIGCLILEVKYAWITTNQVIVLECENKYYVTVSTLFVKEIQKKLCSKICSKMYTEGLV